VWFENLRVESMNYILWVAFMRSECRNSSYC
jgi:hypothetical protein